MVILVSHDLSLHYLLYQLLNYLSLYKIQAHHFTADKLEELKRCTCHSACSESLKNQLFAPLTRPKHFLKQACPE